MKVLVIDNYDSFVYNLVQYIGELGGTPIVYRNDAITVEQASHLSPDRILISPGPGVPQDPRFFGVCSDILRSLSRSIPTLGVCLGHQGIIHVFGGRIGRAKRLMHGKPCMITHDGGGVFKNLAEPFEATRYHSLVGDQTCFPSSLIIAARSIGDDEIMGVRHRTYPIEGIQFHPESILTGEGKTLLKNFLEGNRT
jgi:anthranilate synthase component 2